MKVALVYYGCHRRGGVERVVFEATKYLSCRGHAVHVYAAEWEPIPVLPGAEPVCYHRVPVLPRPSAATSISFMCNSTLLLRRQVLDIINTHGVFCPTGGVHWANSVHQAWLERSNRLHAPFSARRLRQRLNPMHALILCRERQHFRGGYRALIAASQQVARDLARIYAVPEAKIDVINNGFDPDEFNPARRLSLRHVQRSRLGIGAREIVMLMVANELERKGLPVLLEAMRRLKRPELRLVVAGRTAYRPYLHSIEALGLRDQILFIGPTSDVGALHAVADFFVLPTQYEAFCLAIIEALGSGLPVITTSVPGACDAILPGINGLLIHDPCAPAELADRIEQILDETTRLQMQREAASSVAGFQWGRLLNRYEGILSNRP